MIFCTSICANYLPKAAVLAKSIHNHNPNAKVICALLEKELTEDISAYEKYFDEIILAKDLGIENFNEFIFRYSIVEASTSIKPMLMKYLFQKYNNYTKFIYLDPDIKIYNNFAELEKLLDRHEIVLTPHLVTPLNQIATIKSFEINGTLVHGTYNLGFLALKKGEESINFLSWWHERLNLCCNADLKQKGIFTDQKWIDMVPALFNVYILKNPGYNLAPWNLFEREVEKVNNDYFANNNKLIFIHFSGVESGACERLIKQYTNNHSFSELYDEYLNDLESSDHFINKPINWSYNFYLNGEKILDRSRLVMRAVYNNIFINNPFEYDNNYITFENLLELKNKKVFLWGTGTMGISTYELLKGSANIIGWIDSNPQKAELMNLPINAPMDILNEKQNISIIIASSFKEEIIEIIESNEMGRYQLSPLLNPYFIY